MKRISKFIAIGFFLSFAFSANSQEIASSKADSTGLPGDNFSLQGALEMFKNAKSLEEFEKLLNQESNNVNNLDLNGDGKIDYIKVIDNTKNGAHAIVLQVPVSKTESQDIAVIEIEKQGDSKVSVQIIGDEDIYGENIIFEPKNDKEVENGNSKGGPSSSYLQANIWFNAWYWPCIQYMYAPAYIVWVSPWYWDYYPYWWSPWHPYAWGYYYHHSHHYHDYYHHSYNHYGNNAYNAYQPHRRTSDYVVNRHRDDIATYRNTHGNDRRDNVGKTPRKDNISKDNNRVSTQPNYSKPRNGNEVNRGGNVNNSEKDSRNNNKVNRDTPYKSKENKGNIDSKNNNRNSGVNQGQKNNNRSQPNTSKPNKSSRPASQSKKR